MCIPRFLQFICNFSNCASHCMQNFTISILLQSLRKPLILFVYLCDRNITCILASFWWISVLFKKSIQLCQLSLIPEIIKNCIFEEVSFFNPWLFWYWTLIFQLTASLTQKISEMNVFCTLCANVCFHYCLHHNH